ncbi:hypothetical protein [Sphingomicrobium nitratireducens]|uniref:hypothetical protein n=1 Tax=Sphingomicrobium nitratireducens TaxID=2964666 RepID=UPI00223F2D21|nr:hypothetical protein [Sphingomicrobium nitratireducens]
MERVQGRFDRWVDVGAAAVAGIAVGTALEAFSPGLAAAWRAAGALAAFALVFSAMARVGGEEPDLPDFALPPLPFERDADELLLVEEAAPVAAGECEALLLDDLVGALDPGSRVVALFGDGRGAPIPTAGELKARIDRHLAAQAREPAAPGEPALHPVPDAADALRAALHEVRASLR